MIDQHLLATLEMAIVWQDMGCGGGMRQRHSGIRLLGMDTLSNGNYSPRIEYGGSATSVPAR
jgi:hypothetical protein